MSETTQQLILDFDEYIRQGEPSRAEKAQLWQTAIGLQAVDGLSASDYLRSTARKHIEGEISIDEVRALMKAYYEVKSRRTPEDAGLEEADRAAANIAKVLSSQTLDFSTKGFVALHRRIFEGVFKHAGQIRDYDISKREWVLDGASVSYLSWEDLRRALDYDIAQERNCSYKELSDDEKIVHIARFVSGLWQIHPFGEGNTRTTAVFAIQYLRSVGFEVDNEMFARHSWYFRNALVRANYKNVRQGIDYSPMYLERFFRNLLLGERWDLRSRYLHIRPGAEWRVQPKLDEPEGKPAGTGSVQDKHRTSIGSEQDKHRTSIEPEQDKLGTSIGSEQDKHGTSTGQARRDFPSDGTPAGRRRRRGAVRKGDDGIPGPVGARQLPAPASCAGNCGRVSPAALSRCPPPSATAIQPDRGRTGALAQDCRAGVADTLKNNSMKKTSDKFREDFKETFSFLDWFNTMSDDERHEYVQHHAIIREGEEEDPTIIHLKEGETIDDWIKKYNLHDASEIIDRLRNL